MIILRDLKIHVYWENSKPLTQNSSLLGGVFFQMYCFFLQFVPQSTHETSILDVVLCTSNSVYSITLLPSQSCLRYPNHGRPLMGEKKRLLSKLKNPLLSEL